jgi:hypothetical protein
MTHRNVWIEDLVVAASGVVQRPDGRVAIGAVLLIENAAGEIVFVKKAPKPGYEFSGLDTLPGGMLRSAGGGPISPDDLGRIAFESLLMRASAEAGYLPESVPAVIELNPPPTTSYNVGGAQKYVVKIRRRASVRDSGAAGLPPGCLGPLRHHGEMGKSIRGNTESRSRELHHRL